jgi:outer membrane protein assembly factor BamB
MSRQPGVLAGWLRTTLVAVLAGVGTVCGDVVAAPAAPSIGNVTAEAELNNVLSAELRFTARDADSVRAVWDDGNGDSGATPFVETKSGPSRVVVLGLLASHRYAMAVEARGGAAAVVSETVGLTTGELPLPIRSLRLRSDRAASSGLTLIAPLLADSSLAATGFLVAFDSAGDIRWYHPFPGTWPIEAKQLRNGHISVYAGRSYGWQPAVGQFFELAPTGETTRTYSVSSGSYTDPHELLLTFDDTAVVAAHLLGYDVRSFDLRSFGGGASVPLAVHFVERRTPTGIVQFHWSAGDLFTPSDWSLPAAQHADLAHPSSLAIDVDGNYVISFQAMSEVTKLDSRTGTVMWRLGGMHNQFSFQNDARSGFAGQHDVQVLPNGHLLLLDDQLHIVPGPARAVEYALDPLGKTATLVWQHQPNPAIISPIMGSVQRLTRSDATLIGFGAAGRVIEVAGDGSVSWSATLASTDGAPVAFYRAIRLVSLYSYAAP